MSCEATFGPAAQTPTQRAEVLARMKQALPHLRKSSSHAQQLYTRYLAGELTWSQVYLARKNELASGLSPKP